MDNDGLILLAAAVVQKAVEDYKHASRYDRKILRSQFERGLVHMICDYAGEYKSFVERLDNIDRGLGNGKTKH